MQSKLMVVISIFIFALISFVSVVFLTTIKNQSVKVLGAATQQNNTLNISTQNSNLSNIPRISQASSSAKSISVLSQKHERKKTLPPKPVLSGPNCVNSEYIGSGITILGGNINPPAQYAEISGSSSFTDTFRKDMTGSISITGPAGFLKYPDENKQLSLNPDTTYYIRFFNGLANSSGYGPIEMFSFGKCSD